MADEGATTHKRPGRRVDAQRNRSRILDAARTLFAAAGVDAQMDDIARAAGVAVGTLYHHFGTKDALLEGAVLDRFQQAADFAQALHNEPDPWTGVERFVRYLAERQVHDRAFKELVASQHALRERIGIAMRDFTPPVQQLLERAQACGQLRPGVSAADLSLLLMGLPSGDGDDEARERYLAIILDGLRSAGH